MIVVVDDRSSIFVGSVVSDVVVSVFADDLCGNCHP